MQVALAAARKLTYHAAWLRDHGKPFKTEAAIAKLYATEAAIDATRAATQVFGGYGFIDETAVVAALPGRQDPRDRRGDERGATPGDRPHAGPARLSDRKGTIAKKSLQRILCSRKVRTMNTYLGSELATELHREMIGRSDQARLVAAARRQRRADRLTRRAAALAERAAALVERSHR